jgi:HSP20 family protein
MPLFKKQKIQVEHKRVEKKPDKGDIPLDVFQKDDVLYIVALIAGVDHSDIKLSISGDVFTIKGQRFHDHQFNVPDEDFHNDECFWGSFQKSLVFPVKVDSKRVSATFKNGVLTVKLPIVEEKKDEGEVVKIRVS